MYNLKFKPFQVYFFNPTLSYAFPNSNFSITLSIPFSNPDYSLLVKEQSRCSIIAHSRSASADLRGIPKAFGIKPLRYRICSD